MDGGGGGVKPEAAGACHLCFKPASAKTIITSPSSLKRRLPGFTVLTAVDSCRRMMGIRADRSSHARCAVLTKPQTKIRNDRAHAPAGTFVMHPKDGREI